MATRYEGFSTERVDRRAFLGAGAALALGGLGLAGCGGSSSGGSSLNSASAGGGNGSKGVIAFDQPDTSNPVLVPLFAGAKEEGKALGYTVIFNSEELQAARQVSDIDTWLAQGVKGMTVLPLSNNGMGPLAERARKQGVAFVGYAGTIPGESGSIQWDNAQGAKLIGTNAGDWVNKRLGGKAEVAYLTAEFLLTGRQRIDGADHWLRATAPGVNVVARVEAIDNADAYKATQSILSAHPNVNVIICISDDGCVGVAQAFKGTGRSPDSFYTAGYDGSENALKELLVPGSVVRASAALDLIAIGRAAVWVPANIIEKKTPTSYLAPYTFCTQSTPAVTRKLIASYGRT
ncbi:MAG: sugar ABC transporter substrate-binding protein [Solirubrobacteraceae bacterium]